MILAGRMADTAARFTTVEAAAAFDPIGIPQILTGDMNANIKNQAIATLLEGGWADTYAAIHGLGEPGYTFHGFRGKERQLKGRGSKIDWIFIRGDVETLATEIIRDGRDGRYPSDHYFISATLELPSQD